MMNRQLSEGQRCQQDRYERRHQLPVCNRRSRSFDVGRRDSLDSLDEESVFVTGFPRHLNNYAPAPEVILEIPSDSDSSRRVSRCSMTLSDMSPSPSISASPSFMKFKQPAQALSSRPSRRASHAGDSHNRPTLGSLLSVPEPKERKNSLPITIQTEELYMLRSFSIEGKKVINMGDSIRSRRESRTSVSSRGSR